MAVPVLSHSTDVVRPAVSAELDQQLHTEHLMVRSGIRGIIVALPITIAFLVGMMGLAIGDMQPWYVWIGLGVGMGVYAAGFFGSITAVLMVAAKLDRVSTGADLHTAEEH